MNINKKIGILAHPISVQVIQFLSKHGEAASTKEIAVALGLEADDPAAVLHVLELSSAGFLNSNFEHDSNELLKPDGPIVVVNKYQVDLEKVEVAISEFSSLFGMFLVVREEVLKSLKLPPLDS